MKLFIRFLISLSLMGLLGMAVGFIYGRFFSKNLVGGVKAGMIVGTLGCIVGGFLFNVLFDIPIVQKLNAVPYLQVLLVNPIDINFIAAALGMWMFLFIYSNISSQNH